MDYSLNHFQRNMGRPFEPPIYETSAFITHAENFPVLGPVEDEPAQAANPDMVQQ
jgi:hypothetical protein